MWEIPGGCASGPYDIEMVLNTKGPFIYDVGQRRSKIPADNVLYFIYVLFIIT